MLNARALLHWRQHLAVAARRKAKLLQRLAIELVDNRLRLADEAEECRPIEIGPIHMPEILHRVRQFLKPVTAIVDIAFELIRVGSATACQLPFRPTESRQRPKSWCALVVDDVIFVPAGIARRSISPCHAGQA